MTISKDSVPIDTLVDWERFAGPKSAHQWVDGRSAKEAARTWLEGAPLELPSEISSVLESCVDFGPVHEWQAEPEVRLPFDNFPGEPRNSDLVLWARDVHGPFVVAVEAKADESFGRTVGETLCDGLEKRIENPGSNLLDRVEQLARSLLPAQAHGGPSAAGLRYQLLTACAGALAEAKRGSYSRAVMLVHEFITDKTDDGKHQANAADMDSFLRRLSAGKLYSMEPGKLFGPFLVPGYPLFSGKTCLYYGKVQRDKRQ
ncbi:MAG: hypothetical protein V5B78_12885 [Desulfohalobiaceae bacterium]